MRFLCAFCALFDEHTRSPAIAQKQKSPETLVVSGLLAGGLEGDRTLDLTDANRTLSQLSYEPIVYRQIVSQCLLF